MGDFSKVTIFRRLTLRNQVQSNEERSFLLTATKRLIKFDISPTKIEGQWPVNLVSRGALPISIPHLVHRQHKSTHRMTFKLKPSNNNHTMGRIRRCKDLISTEIIRLGATKQ